VTTLTKPVPTKPYRDMTPEEHAAWHRQLQDYNRAVDQRNHERARKAADTREERDRAHREMTQVYGRDVIDLIHHHFGAEVKTQVIEGGTFRPFGYTTNFRSGDRYRTSDTYKWGTVDIQFREGSEEAVRALALEFRDWLKSQGITATPTGDEESDGLYIWHPRKSELPVWTTSLTIELAQIAEKAGTKEPEPVR